MREPRVCLYSLNNRVKKIKRKGKKKALRNRMFYRVFWGIARFDLYRMACTRVQNSLGMLLDPFFFFLRMGDDFVFNVNSA